MGSLVLGGGFNVVGDDEDDMEVGRGPARRSRAAVRVPTPKWMNATTSQGVSRPEEEMDFLPFESVLLATGTVAGTLIADPQRPFRGERLILGAVDLDTGNDARHLMRIDPCIFVGMVNVGSSLGGTPFSMFAPDAFGVRLSFPPAGQGTKIRIPFIAAVNASTAGLQITGGVVGRAMR